MEINKAIRAPLPSSINKVYIKDLGIIIINSGKDENKKEV